MVESRASRQRDRPHQGRVQCEGGPLDEPAYSDLLGLYLGDGWLSRDRIVRSYPRQLLRGLIHSDGCRAINRVRNGKHAYPRYFFTNSSADILEIFRQTCDAVGISHRDSNVNTISVARKEAVAALQAFMDPKG
jgi:hypothetical protein